MLLDTFERYKHNAYLSPVTTKLLERLGAACGLGPGANVLEAGCGAGGACVTLAKRFGCTVTGVERRPEFAEEARCRVLFDDLTHMVHILVHEGEELPFDDGFFDFALSLFAPRPADFEPVLPELARAVRPAGRIVLSGLVWRPGAAAKASPAVRSWLARLGPAELCEPEEIANRLEARGFPVEEAGLVEAEGWEAFYAPQARTILENRREYGNEAGAREVLDAWQEELELYHRGGGKEALGYAYFVLRRP